MPPFPVDPEKDTICDVIHRWAEERPDAPLLFEEGRIPLTYADVVAQMDAIATVLHSRGLGNGNRIAIVHSGGSDMAVALVSIMNVASAVPLDPNLTKAEFDTYVQHRGVEAVVIEEGLTSAIRDVAKSRNLQIFDLVSVESDSRRGVRLDPRTSNLGVGDVTGISGPNDIALVLATSGTTARNKVVASRHERLVRSARMEVQPFGLKREDRGLIIRPLYYSGAIHNLLAVLYSGGSCIAMDDFQPDAFFRYLNTLSPSWFSGGPIFQKLIHTYGKANCGAASKSSLRLIRLPSGQLDLQTINELEEFFSAQIIESYSSSETGLISANPLTPGGCRRGSVGVPIECDVRIRSLHGSYPMCGERGEVVVRSPILFEGYENDPAANEEAFVDGWFRTGDEGFLDEDGYLTLTGRIKEMINRGGENVSPAEVDAALMGHPDVREAATFPIPHPTLGEEVGAVVVQAPGAALTDQILTKYLLGRLSGFKMPKLILFAEEIPKSGTGKVQRHKLAETFGVKIGAK